MAFRKPRLSGWEWGSEVDGPSGWEVRLHSRFLFTECGILSWFIWEVDLLSSLAVLGCWKRNLRSDMEASLKISFRLCRKHESTK